MLQQQFRFRLRPILLAFVLLLPAFAAGQEVILDDGSPQTSSGGIWYPSGLSGGYEGDSLVSGGGGPNPGDWYKWPPN